MMYQMNRNASGDNGRSPLWDGPHDGQQMADETQDDKRDAQHRRRDRVGIRGELLLALPPTITVLLVYWGVELVSSQRLLFASLASSAFLIYLNPNHTVNSVRTLAGSQVIAATTGLLALRLLGPGYGAIGTAMIMTILLLVTLDLVHPPAISTALTFALRPKAESEVLLFGLAIAMTLALVILQRGAQQLILHLDRQHQGVVR